MNVSYSITNLERLNWLMMALIRTTSEMTTSALQNQKRIKKNFHNEKFNIYNQFRLRIRSRNAFVVRTSGSFSFIDCLPSAQLRTTPIKTNATNEQLDLMENVCSDIVAPWRMNLLTQTNQLINAMATRFKDIYCNWTLTIVPRDFLREMSVKTYLFLLTTYYWKGPRPFRTIITPCRHHGVFSRFKLKIRHSHSKTRWYKKMDQDGIGKDFLFLLFHLRASADRRRKPHPKEVLQSLGLEGVKRRPPINWSWLSGCVDW